MPNPVRSRPPSAWPARSCGLLGGATPTPPPRRPRRPLPARHSRGPDGHAECLRAGEPQDPDRRHADDRHRQPRHVPASAGWREYRRRGTPSSRAIPRPAPAVESAVPTRSRTSSASRRSPGSRSSSTTRYAPGPKAFDFYLAQVSATPERAANVNLSDGYYWLNQSLVAVGGSTIASAKTIADLKSSSAPRRHDELRHDRQRHQARQGPEGLRQQRRRDPGPDEQQIDGLVVDLPTAFYVTAADNGVIVGQLAPTGASRSISASFWPRASADPACVNQALAAMADRGREPRAITN